MEMGKVQINGTLETNGPVYANGPVFVMGMDIKTEIDRLKIDVEGIKSYKQEQIERIEKIVRLLLEKNDLQTKDRSNLKLAIDTAVEITDWAQRIKFWYETLKVLGNPFLLNLIFSLLKIQS